MPGDAASLKIAQMQAESAQNVANVGADASRFGATTAAGASMYGADQGLKGAGLAADASKYGADRSAQASMYGADQAAAAHRYGADQGLAGVKYGADSHLTGTMYGADRLFDANKYRVDNDPLRFSKGTPRVQGQGDGTVDTVDAKLAPGEAVLNKAAAEMLGRGLIDLLNKHGMLKMGMPDPHEEAEPEGYACGTSKVGYAGGTPFVPPGGGSGVAGDGMSRMGVGASPEVEPNRGYPLRNPAREGSTGQGGAGTMPDRFLTTNGPNPVTPFGMPRPR